MDGMHPTGMHSCCIYFLNFDFRCWFVACLFVVGFFAVWKLIL